MLATISWSKPLAFCLTLVTTFWSALVSDATSSIALCTLSEEHEEIMLFSVLPAQSHTHTHTLLYNQFLPCVIEDVVYHIAGEHVFVNISLQHKEHIAQSPCQPASMPA